MSTKDHVLEAIRRLPDDAKIEDVIEALCLQMTIEERLQELDAGRFVEHEDAKQRLLST